MALAVVDSAVRADFLAGATSTGRGLILNGRQVEVILVTKLTADVTGSIDLLGIRRPFAIKVMPTRDAAGANVSALAVTSVVFTHTDNDTVALTGLGSWTAALIFVEGRSFSF